MPARRHPISALISAVVRLFGGEAGAGSLLIAVALIALALANSPWDSLWHGLFHHALPASPIARLSTLHLWISDGLMALFFFVVGLEIKREVLEGELAHPAQRRLPVLAAVLGMAVPAMVFLLVTRNVPELGPGWAIPAATDIAFAVGVIALLGSAVPPSLRLFLLTVAIVDDLGAVAIIALAYTAKIDPGWLIAAALVLAAMATMNRLGIKRGWAYALSGTILWFCVLHSGVHATVAGVLAALTVPIALDRQGESLLLRMEHVLAPVSAYFIVPLFGLANAGVTLPAAMPNGAALILPLGIALGLVAGKTCGIFCAVLLAERSGFARRPSGANWNQVLGLSALCGIGFTMSLFIGQLAFPANPALVEDAKLGVLSGSLVAGIFGYAILRLSVRQPQT
ncbi:MAG: Na+/H+ antiporter NhaA [Novosphingobium sp.]|uniref:Na+/H+ antiporter NhaA n=1 Tax=Novosphingobium sp. TaxID=1874826 RepID=UPI0032BBA475